VVLEQLDSLRDLVPGGLPEASDVGGVEVVDYLVLVRVLEDRWRVVDKSMFVHQHALANAVEFDLIQYFLKPLYGKVYAYNTYVRLIFRVVLALNVPRKSQPWKIGVGVQVGRREDRVIRIFDRVFVPWPD
jgi:hypothetical protein